MTVDRDPRVSVVVLTHNRADELLRTLHHLAALPERPALIVVDNGCADDTAVRVRIHFPEATLVRCGRNLGAAGRNAGVACVQTPYVAFCDDDTWWEGGALRRAADLLDRHPSVGALSGRVLVGADDQLDPTCARMATSPLDSRGMPGPALIAFMAGAVIMRARAFRQVGGYEPRLFLGAEGQLMAFDLAARDWHIVYARDVVTHHRPSAVRSLSSRHIVTLRNRLWIAWLRLPLASAMRETCTVLRAARAADLLAASLARALLGLPWALVRRRVVPPHVDLMHRRVFAPATVRSAPDADRRCMVDKARARVDERRTAPDSGTRSRPVGMQ